MSNSEQIRESSIPIELKQLPKKLRSIGVAFNFDQAKPELQQELVDELHDGLKQGCTSNEKEATEQLISEVLAKASSMVTQHEVERADQDLKEMLTQVDSEVRIKLEGLLRRRNAAIDSQAKRQAASALQQSPSRKRRARVKVTSAEVAQAVASLDTGQGVTNAQVEKALSVSRPKATSLLKAAAQSGLLMSSEPSPGVSTRFSMPKPKAEGSTPEPSQEGDSVKA